MRFPPCQPWSRVRRQESSRQLHPRIFQLHAAAAGSVRWHRAGNSQVRPTSRQCCHARRDCYGHVSGARPRFCSHSLPSTRPHTADVAAPSRSCCLLNDHSPEQARLQGNTVRVHGHPDKTAAERVQVVDGQVKPTLQRLEQPVRAIVAPISDRATAERLHAAFVKHLVPVAASSGLWEQDHGLYHSTVWHASPHQVPPPLSRLTVSATEQTVVGTKPSHPTPRQCSSRAGCLAH